MPHVQVKIPTPMRKLTGGRASLTASASTVGELVLALDREHPGLKDRLLDGDGRLHPFVALFVGEDEVRTLQELSTPLGEAAVVTILPALAGG
jgi:molybdopterin synthase sulfur carrier subunit